MKFARIVFLVAGLYGAVLLFSMFFTEETWGREYPPPITHPEFYYGFVTTVFAWQLVYLLISRDPARYRPMMLLAVFAKTSFAVASFVLLALGRVPTGLVLGSGVDLVLAALFVYAFIITKPPAPTTTPG